MSEQPLLQLTGILVLGAAAQWLATVLRIPAILLLLFVGFTVGPGCELAVFDKLIDPDKLLGPLLFPVVSLSVALILFEGGLSLTFAEISQLRDIVTRLVAVGGLVNWILGSLGANWILGFSWPLSILTGLLLVVTGPTVIGPLLRFIRPSGSVGPILKWEGITIDPIGAMLAALVFQSLATPDLSSALTSTAFGVFKTMFVGGGIGAFAAGSVVLSLKRFWIPDALHTTIILMFIAASYTSANLLQGEAGLVAVTVMGILLANQRQTTITHIAEFKENLTVILISMLFIVLSARLHIADFREIGISSLLFAGFMIVVARPLSVAIATWRTSLRWRERVFLACMAPRGIVAAAVASVFAIQLSSAGYSDAAKLAPTVFVMIVVSVIVYSIAASGLARALGLSVPPTGFLIAGANPLALAIGGALKDAGALVLLVDNNPSAVREARLQGMPVMLGSIISRYAQDRIELSGLGRLLALTPNQEANTLADISFAKTFGRENVFQLSVAKSSEGRHEKIHEDMQGRVLFGSEYTYAKLSSLIDSGAMVKRTPLTSQFTMVDYQARYGDSAVPLFIIDQFGVATPIAGGQTPIAREGQSVLGLVAADAGQKALVANEDLLTSEDCG